MRAFDLLPEARFDAIIADEGQDFLPLWWAAIDAGLMPGSASRLRIFFDSNQRVYESIGKLPEDVQLAPIRLTQNLRSTQRIHHYVMPQYEGFAITAPGPEGVPVELVETETARSIPRRLEKLVTRLMAENLRPEDIAVLVDTPDQIATLAPRGKSGGWSAVRAVAMRPGALTVDTIREFKGLDSRAVIVVCTAGMAAEKELPYVAFSRARTHLILLGPAAVVDQFRDATSIEVHSA